MQPISAAQALKPYRCPGCGGVVEQGVAHVVVWRADGVLGDQADLEARRHWHRTAGARRERGLVEIRSGTLVADREDVRSTPPTG